jgi:hypothetical protein
MKAFTGLFLVALNLGAAKPELPIVIPPSVISPVAGAAEQVRRCYRSPKVGRAARQITTRLQVKYTSDGMLAELPAVISQSGITPENQGFAAAMAEAAIAAVIQCSPLRLPPEKYQGGWDEFELTFSPKASA